VPNRKHSRRIGNAILSHRRGSDNFYGKLYRALTRDFPIEAALSEARKSIYIMPNEVEWAMPVLYMRSDSGYIFKEKSINTNLVPNITPPTSRALHQSIPNVIQIFHTAGNQ
jgi:hypothetical protein